MTTSTLHLGIFYMSQIYDMGPTALLPLRRKACWGFFRPLKIRWLRPGLNPRTWVLKASTLPLYWPVKGFCFPDDDDDDAVLLQSCDNLSNYYLSNKTPVTVEAVRWENWKLKTLNSVILQMHSIATIRFSRSPPDLSFLVTFFHICVHVK